MYPKDYLLVCVVLLSFLLVENKCDNSTKKYLQYDGTADNFKNGRHYRFLTFNTQDNGEIQVELDFAIPFVKIPVKKSLDMGKTAIANVDIGSVLFGGGLAFTLGIMVPAAFIFLSNKMSTTVGIPNGSYRKEGSATATSKWWKMMTAIDHVLLENNIDTASCAQKILCWTVKTSANNVVKGNATSGDKIINGLATNEWLKWMVEDTAFEVAINNGLNDNNCSKEFGSCQINQQMIQDLTQKFIQNFAL